MASQMTTVGKIVAPFGIRGEVKVYPYSDFLERCSLLKKVQLENEGTCLFKVVQKASIHKNMWILHFEDCHTREEAQKLTGSLVKILSSERVPLPPGSYYLDQIIGLEALTTAGEKLGSVGDIIKTGSNDVYVVYRDTGDGKAPGGGKEILVPALKSVVKEINLEKGYILLELPEGLLE
ncbi:MAG: 16S rRNA processing protein RimM [Dethiobacter sp.]|jgi:16S rRNA processing protein RimM|nr:MAG: 16S rRNA processing protein RimM [Dethiobacter sp.]